MANEGSTKPTYSELERQLKSAKDALFSMQVDRETRTGREQRLTASLARVRGLLQRAFDEIVTARYQQGKSGYDDATWVSGHPKRVALVAKTIAEFELAPSGAESADIGKLDTADESANWGISGNISVLPKSGVEMGKVNRVEEKEPNVEKCAKCLWPLTNWRHDYKKEYHEFVHVTKPRNLSTSTDDLDFGSPLARKITERVARDAVRVLLMRHSSDIDIHEDAPTEAELEQDVVNILLGDDLGCLDPEDVSDENCTVLIVDKLLKPGGAETGGEKAAPQFSADEQRKIAQVQACMDSVGEKWVHPERYSEYERGMGLLFAWEWDTAGSMRDCEFAEVIAAAVQRASTFPRTSQNQTVSGGVEGAHEGTTADKSELLPTQLPPDR